MTELNERVGLLHGVAHRFGDFLPIELREGTPVYQRDDVADAVALSTARALLRVDSRAEAADVLQAALRDLGGRVVPARFAGVGTLRIDVSLGQGAAKVVSVAGLDERSSLRLAAHLPALTADALEAASRCERHPHVPFGTYRDALTGVSDRQEVAPRLSIAHPGDVICVIDLDDFSSLNRRLGRRRGDQVLADFADRLQGHFREGDFIARYAGDVFVVVLSATPAVIAIHRLQQFFTSWNLGSPVLVTFSSGVAFVDRNGPELAFDAAARAMRRAKGGGRNRLEVAVAEDFVALPEDQVLCADSTAQPEPSGEAAMLEA